MQRRPQARRVKTAAPATERKLGAQAKALAEALAAKPRGAGQTAKAKIVAKLKRLHPMD